jgi:hypothetical protein
MGMAVNNPVAFSCGEQMESQAVQDMYVTVCFWISWVLLLVLWCCWSLEFRARCFACAVATVARHLYVFGHLHRTQAPIYSKWARICEVGLSYFQSYTFSLTHSHSRQHCFGVWRFFIGSVSISMGCALRRDNGFSAVTYTCVPHFHSSASFVSLGLLLARAPNVS